MVGLRGYTLSLTDPPSTNLPPYLRLYHPSNSYFSFFYIAFFKRTVEASELKQCAESPGYVKALTSEPAVGNCAGTDGGCYKGCGSRYIPMDCMGVLLQASSFASRVNIRC